MPYYGSGIMRENTNVLKDMAALEQTSLRTKQEDERNALYGKSLDLRDEDIKRKKMLEDRWIDGVMMGSVVDGGESYQNFRRYGMEKYGNTEAEEAFQTTFPEEFDPKSFNTQKRLNNELYTKLGRRTPIMIDVTNKQTGASTKVDVLGGQFDRMFNKDNPNYAGDDVWIRGKVSNKRSKKYVATTREQMIADLEDEAEIKAKYKKGKVTDYAKKSKLYISTMNQILKEYGGSGSSFKIDPETNKFSFSTGGDKAYQDMRNKAKSGDERAKTNLEKYENYKEKLYGLAGEKTTRATTDTPDWRLYK